MSVRAGKEHALSQIEVDASVRSEPVVGARAREHRAADVRIPGIFHVRVADAGPRERTAVARVIGGGHGGAAEATIARAATDAAGTGATENERTAEEGTDARAADRAETGPDVRLRFVPELVRPPALRVIDGGRAGFVHEDAGVYVLDGVGRAPRALIRQERAWGRASIVCRRGEGSVPGLAGALDLAALRRGWIPLHGSAWTRTDGVCLVLSGWAHSGKTGALLAACARGATVIGDDRVFLARDGGEVVGTGRPVVVKEWHRAQLDPSALGVPRRALAPLASAARLAPATARLLARSRLGSGTLGRVASKLLERVRRLGEIEVDPARLGTPAGGHPGNRPHALIVLETHDRPSVVAERLAPGRAAEMVAAQVAADLSATLRLQVAFEYAEPGGGWRGVDRAGELVRELLDEATPALPCWLLRHPYPCSLTDLDAALDEIARSIDHVQNGG